METHAPQYYSSFRCLAGECPHTCCAAGWEIPVDPGAAALYAALPGPLGDRVRAFMENDPEGEPCFPLRGGVCPFLNGEGLCHIHIQHGEGATPLICRTHPRFCYDYGPLRERGLCASCPEAARLILGGDMELVSGVEEGTGEDTPPLLSPLLMARETAFALLAAGETSLSQRLQALLLFANEVQVLLDENQPEAIPQLCQFYSQEFPLLSPEGLPPRREALGKCLDILEGLDILQPQWKALLAQGKAQLSQSTPPPPFWGERCAVYFLYRHWLRGVWDADVLTWAEFAVLGTAVSALLSPLQAEGFPGAFRMFCQELEHSEGNMSALQDALWDSLSLAELLAVGRIE